MDSASDDCPDDRLDRLQRAGQRGVLRSARTSEPSRPVHSDHASYTIIANWVVSSASCSRHRLGRSSRCGINMLPEIATRQAAVRRPRLRTRWPRSDSSRTKPTRSQSDRRRPASPRLKTSGSPRLNSWYMSADHGPIPAMLSKRSGPPVRPRRSARSSSPTSTRRPSSTTQPALRVDMPQPRRLADP